MTTTTVTPLSSESPPQPVETGSKDHSVKLFEAAIQAQNARKEAIERTRSSLSGRCNPLDPDSDLWLVGGDFLSMGYLSLQTAGSFVPSLASATAFQTASLTLGIAGGVINLAVGVACVTKGFKQLQKPGDMNRLEGYRNLWDGFLMLLVGSVMLATPILMKFFATAAITTFLSNPILLSVLFALLSGYITYEILHKLIPMWQKKDLGSRILETLQDREKTLKLLFDLPTEDTSLGPISSQKGVDIFSKMKHLQQVLIYRIRKRTKSNTELLTNQKTWENLTDQEKVSLKEILSSAQMLSSPEDAETLYTLLTSETANLEKLQALFLADRMTEVEGDLGVKSAIEFFKLIHLLLQNFEEPNEATQSKIKKTQESLKKEIDHWKFVQCVRLTQQFFYIGASLLTFASFIPGIAAHVINGIVNGSMTIANLIPFYMDLMWPWGRNVKITLDKLTDEEILELFREILEKSNSSREELLKEKNNYPILKGFLRVGWTPTGLSPVLIPSS